MKHDWSRETPLKGFATGKCLASTGSLSVEMHVAYTKGMTIVPSKANNKGADDQTAHDHMRVCLILFALNEKEVLSTRGSDTS